MPYTNVWSASSPTGLEAANTIDNIIRAFKLDVQERFMDIFDMPSFSQDPLRPYNIKFSSLPGSNKIIGGATGGIQFRNAADTFTNLGISDAGEVSLRNNLTLSSGGLTVSNSIISVSSPALQFNGIVLSGAHTNYYSVKVYNSTTTVDTELMAYGSGTGAQGGVGTVSNHPFIIVTNFAERIRVGATGIISVGTAVVTSAAADEIVLANNKAIRGVNAAGTDTIEIIKLNASNFTELPNPTNFTGLAGLAIGSVPGRRRITTTGAENFEIVGDSNALCTVDVLDVRSSSGFLARTRTGSAYGNGAAASAGTLTNAPSAGNPTKWLPIVDNGTTRYIPAW